MPVNVTEHPYLWKPILNRVFLDRVLARNILEKGYAVLPLLDEETLNALNAIYANEHALNVDNGGMFYTLYSKDLEYRNRVHTAIHEVLDPILKKNFINYKNVVNSFVVKSSGKQSEFYVHQDTTTMDEQDFSPLSLWIPLQEIDSTNGALTLIEKTHWFFSPYRGVSFSFPFKSIVNTVRKYLKPIYLKPGEVLLFDPRVIHNSMENSSGKDRVAIICGIFDKEAEFQTCFKDPSSPGNPIEIYRHEDDYTLKYPNFFYDCHVRPVSGEKIGEIEDLFPPMDAETFEKLCALNKIPVQNILDDESGVNCNLIAEPDGINRFEPVLVENEHSEKKSGLLSWFRR